MAVLKPLNLDSEVLPHLVCTWIKYVEWWQGLSCRVGCVSSSDVPSRLVRLHVEMRGYDTTLHAARLCPRWYLGHGAFRPCLWFATLCPCEAHPLTALLLLHPEFHKSMSKPVLIKSCFELSKHWFRLSCVVHCALASSTVSFVAAWSDSGNAFWTFRHAPSTVNLVSCSVPRIEASINCLISFPFNYPSPTWLTCACVTTICKNLPGIFGAGPLMVDSFQRDHPWLLGTQCFLPSTLSHPAWSLDWACCKCFELVRRRNLMQHGWYHP